MIKRRSQNMLTATARCGSGLRTKRPVACLLLTVPQSDDQDRPRGRDSILIVARNDDKPSWDMVLRPRRAIFESVRLLRRSNVDGSYIKTIHRKSRVAVMMLEV